jgi:hypothetical protein
MRLVQPATLNKDRCGILRKKIYFNTSNGKTGNFYALLDVNTMAGDEAISSQQVE